MFVANLYQHTNGGERITETTPAGSALDTNQDDSSSQDASFEDCIDESLFASWISDVPMQSSSDNSSPGSAASCLFSFFSLLVCSH